MPATKPEHENTSRTTSLSATKSTLARLASKGYFRHCGFEGTDEEAEAVLSLRESDDWFEHLGWAPAQVAKGRTTGIV
jgi:hypothetical protein